MVTQRTWLERQLKGIRRFWANLGRLMPERIWLTWVMFCVVWGTGYPDARPAVRKAATEPALKRLEAQDYINNKGRLYPQMGENIFRNLEAAEWTAHYLREHGRDVPSHRRELLVELAYLALKERGR